MQKRNPNLTVWLSFYIVYHYSLKIPSILFCSSSGDNPSAFLIRFSKDSFASLNFSSSLLKSSIYFFIDFCIFSWSLLLSPSVVDKSSFWKNSSISLVNAFFKSSAAWYYNCFHMFLQWQFLINTFTYCPCTSIIAPLGMAVIELKIQLSYKSVSTKAISILIGFPRLVSLL